VANNILGYILNGELKKVEYEGLEVFLPHIPKEILPPYSLRDSREISLDFLRFVSRIFFSNGIRFSVAGSLSLYLQIPEFYTNSIHDVDIIVNKKDLERIILILQGNGFDVWPEDDLHTNILNLTGGYGRHHNYGFCSNKFLNFLGLQIWGGIFCYEQCSDGLNFYETYGISEWKVNMAFNSHQNIQFHSDPEIRILDHPDIFGETQNKLNDIDFWDFLRSSSINHLDFARREKIRQRCRLNVDKIISSQLVTDRNMPEIETLYDVVMTTTYPISSEEYLFRKSANIGINSFVYVIPVEVSFLRFTHYYPHYLGPRSKYLIQLEDIKKSKILNKQALDYCHSVYASARIKHKVKGRYNFNPYLDKTADIDALNSIFQNNLRVIEKFSPNYLSMLQDNVHFTAS